MSSPRRPAPPAIVVATPIAKRLINMAVRGWRVKGRRGGGRRKRRREEEEGGSEGVERLRGHDGMRDKSKQEKKNGDGREAARSVRKQIDTRKRVMLRSTGWDVCTTLNTIGNIVEQTIMKNRGEMNAI
eukprot:757379-Hanusia_phi.AAC.11